MKTIYYSKDVQFELTDSEFEGAMIYWRQNKHCYISRLDVALSPHWQWAGRSSMKSTKGRLHDGTMVEKKFGDWKDVVNPNVRLDPKYYPEIATDNVMTEEEWQEHQNELKLLPKNYHESNSLRAN